MGVKTLGLGSFATQHLLDSHSRSIRGGASVKDQKHGRQIENRRDSRWDGVVYLCLFLQSVYSIVGRTHTSGMVL